LFRNLTNHVQEPPDADVLLVLRNKLLLSVQIYFVMLLTSSSKIP
jgi:hypothetical protein